MTTDLAIRDEFVRFVDIEGRQIQRALVARYGVDVGGEAAADAFAFAWEHWPELREMDNPAGYLFRVGQSRSRPYTRWLRREHTFPDYGPADGIDTPELIDLFRGLRRLDTDQRTALVLVKSYGYSHRQVGRVRWLRYSLVHPPTCSTLAIVGRTR